MLLEARVLVEGLLGWWFWSCQVKNSTKQKKTLHTSLVWGFNVVHECGRDCVQWTVRYLLPPDSKRRRIDQGHVDFVPAQIRTGVG